MACSADILSLGEWPVHVVWVVHHQQLKYQVDGVVGSLRNNLLGLVMVPVQALEALALVGHYWGQLKHTSDQQHGSWRSLYSMFHISRLYSVDA